ncbi:hypothetical protein T09_189 [Trichinella sp. T9]|nr:hypothetical protein T09_189 [Trichinella sp. T9]
MKSSAISNLSVEISCICSIQLCSGQLNFTNGSLALSQAYPDSPITRRLRHHHTTPVTVADSDLQAQTEGVLNISIYSTTHCSCN